MAATNKVRKQITMNLVDIAQALQSIHIVGTPITANISTGWIFVGQGNIVRVVVAANTYFSFASDATGAVAIDASTLPGVMLTIGESYLVCSSDYIRASANPTRVELLDV